MSTPGLPSGGFLGAAHPGRPFWCYAILPRTVSPSLSDASPAKRVAEEDEEQGSVRSFRRQAETKQSGLCDESAQQLQHALRRKKLRRFISGFAENSA